MAPFVLGVRLLGAEHTDLIEDRDQVDEGERVEQVIERAALGLRCSPLPPPDHRLARSLLGGVEACLRA